MKIPAFPAALAAVVVGGVAVGWLAAAPSGKPLDKAQAPAPAQPAPDPSADAEDRQRLRQAVLGAAQVLRSNPCNGQAKAQFLSAAQAYLAAYTRAVGQGPEAPPEWRSPGDDQVRATLTQMSDDGVADGAELARVVTAATTQGPAAPAAPDLPAGPTPACLRYRASQSGGRF